MTDFSKDAKIFKALCDTKRLTILDYLKSGEKCACVLIENMNIGQSALSYHMKILCDSGIVDEYVKTGAGHFNLVKDTSDFGWNTYISWEDFAGTGGFLCDKISSSLQFTDGFAAV